jgi:hypothetical protein
MSFYETLAAEKASGQRGGEFIAPEQRGTIMLHGVMQKTSGLQTFAILVGEIVNAESTNGGRAQLPGTLIKKVFCLSKYPFHLKMLKTDLVNVTGLNEKEVTQKQTAELFKGCFEDDGLKGVLCSFVCKTVKREGKPDISNTHFTHLSEKQGNSDDEIAKRAEGIETPK